MADKDKDKKDDRTQGGAQDHSTPVNKQRAERERRGGQ
jgi:hypothetical protein